MGLVAWRARKTTLLPIPALSQVGAAGRFVSRGKLEHVLVADFERVCEPIEEPGLAKVLRDHVLAKFAQLIHRELHMTFSV